MTRNTSTFASPMADLLVVRTRSSIVVPNWTRRDPVAARQRVAEIHTILDVRAWRVTVKCAD